MWVTSATLGVERGLGRPSAGGARSRSHRRTGQIEIIPHTEWYLLGGSFDQDRVLKGWVEKLEAALARGCAGLRLSGNTFWLEKSDWQGFTDYEAAVDDVIGQYRMLALCTYSLERCGASEVADVIQNHQFALIKRDGRWELLESFDRRRAGALRESEVRYRLLFDNLSEGLAVHELLSDAQGRPCDYRFLEVNPAFERLTGLKREHAVGRTLLELLPGSDRFWIERYAEVVATGVPARFESREETLGRHYEVFAFRTRPGQFATLFFDVTERRRAEEGREQLISAARAASGGDRGGPPGSRERQAAPGSGDERASGRCGDHRRPGRQPAEQRRLRSDLARAPPAAAVRHRLRRLQGLLAGHGRGGHRRAVGVPPGRRKGRAGGGADAGDPALRRQSRVRPQ